MRRSFAKFSESEASNHMPSLADFTTTTPELKFSVHTGVLSIGNLHQFGPRKVEERHFNIFARLAVLGVVNVRCGRDSA